MYCSNRHSIPQIFDERRMRMTDLEQRIYNDIKSSEQFYFSSSASEKYLENEAIKNLISRGLIVKTSETLGYIIGYVI